MGVIRNYEDFTWNNQTIRGKFVNFVRVRIFKHANIITSDGSEDLVYTDSLAIKQSPLGYLHISDHSVTIFSTGIRNRAQVNLSKPSLYLHIKVCLANTFDISKLNDVNFLGKFYVMQAIQGKTTSEPFLSPLLSYFRKKIGSDYEKIYHLLESAAQEYEIDTVEQLFKEYQISGNYQALFWKELYLQTKNSKNEK